VCNESLTWRITALCVRPKAINVLKANLTRFFKALRMHALHLSKLSILYAHGCLVLISMIYQSGHEEHVLRFAVAERANYRKIECAASKVNFSDDSMSKPLLGQVLCKRNQYARQKSSFHAGVMTHILTPLPHLFSPSFTYWAKAMLPHQSSHTPFTHHPLPAPQPLFRTCPCASHLLTPPLPPLQFDLYIRHHSKQVIKHILRPLARPIRKPKVVLEQQPHHRRFEHVGREEAAGTSLARTDVSTPRHILVHTAKTC
jgi:hypothetical protein